MACFKIFTLFFVVIVGCFAGKMENLENPFVNSTFDPDKIISSSYSAMFAFEGFDLICIAVEEIFDSER